jgi:oligoribonuclease
MNDRLVWIDCEMTGLDIERDALIEIACVVTDSELNLLDDGIDVIIKPPAEALDQMSDVVRDMHTKSGLLVDLPGGVTIAEATDAATSGSTSVRRARRRCAATRSPPTAGSSPATCPSWTTGCTTG